MLTASQRVSVAVVVIAVAGLVGAGSGLAAPTLHGVVQASTASATSSLVIDRPPERSPAMSSLPWSTRICTWPRRSRSRPAGIYPEGWHDHVRYKDSALAVAVLPRRRSARASVVHLVVRKEDRRRRCGSRLRGRLDRRADRRSRRPPAEQRDIDCCPGDRAADGGHHPARLLRDARNAKGHPARRHDRAARHQLERLQPDELGKCRRSPGRGRGHWRAYGDRRHLNETRGRSARGAEPTHHAATSATAPSASSAPSRRPPPRRRRPLGR